MAKRIKQTFDLIKLSKKLDGIYVDAINVLGSRCNLAIQDNINNGGDPKFEKLKKSTLRLGGKQPLNRSGKLKKGIKKTPATKASQVFKLDISTKYGALHHTGYTTDPKSAIPNAKVPPRKWFLVPKSIQPGGADFEKMMFTIKAQIASAWRKNG